MEDLTHTEAEVRRRWFPSYRGLCVRRNYFTKRNENEGSSRQKSKCQSSKSLRNKSPAIKGVPTDITDQEFREFLDLNKINHAKADCLKSKKDSRVLPIFQLEINDPTEAEALISQNLVSNVTGIVNKVEEFRQPVSVTHCFNCQSFGHSEKKCRSKQKCLICGGSHSRKGCPNKEARKSKCANCKGRHVASYKGVLNTKSRNLGSMW